MISGGHSIVQLAGKFRCLTCLRVATKQRNLMVTKCLGEQSQAHTHRLWQSECGALFCARCGVFSRDKTRLLLRPCRGAPQIAGQRVLAAFFTAGAKPAGGELHDAMLEQVSTYMAEHSATTGSEATDDIDIATQGVLRPSGPDPRLSATTST